MPLLSGQDTKLDRDVLWCEDSAEGEFNSAGTAYRRRSKREIAFSVDEGLVRVA